MLQSGTVVLFAFAYLGVLFAIAYWADRRASRGRPVIGSAYVYALSLAVYATAWTFYGSVGRAASDGVGFLPIYLGPTLMIALWWSVMRKMLRISKTHRITSLADFIGSRYGKSTALAAAVTVIAVVGVVPYISLQLKAISSSYTILMQYPAVVMPEVIRAVPFARDTAFWVALMLALFTIAFGTRKLDAAEHHQGMVAAIAFESIVKLLAFLAVGVYVTWGLYSGLGDIFYRAASQPALAPLLTPLEGVAGSYANWVWLTVLSMLAIMFLPRQFQVAVVENMDEQHLRKAMWLFPLYMLAMNLFVLPIAFGGLLLFPDGAVDADTFVLTIPMSQGQQAIALLVFIGGLSAATGMVIVETIALSTMVCNDLVMPVLLRLPGLQLNRRRHLAGLLLGIRRGAIVLILLLGYLYFRLAGEAYALVSIGLISFAAVAQFAPAALGGIYWKGATRKGAAAGLFGGFSVWLYTLLLPAFARSGWLPEGFIESGPFGIELLKPTALFGLAGLDNITHAMIWSMLANLGTYVGVSLFTSQSAQEAHQASLFVDVYRQGTDAEAQYWRGSVDASELHTLLSRFVGERDANETFSAWARTRGSRWPDPALQADPQFLRMVETQLSGVIGAASAHIVIAAVVKEEALSLDEVRAMLDEASQIIVYSHRLEQKSRELELATEELRAANERLKELDRLKDDFVSTVSHELRTPLTSIRAFSEILRDNPELEPGERERFLGVVIKETERLTRLINQILDISKLESGAAEWQVSRFDLKELIEDAVLAMSQMFRERNAVIETRLVDMPVTVTADLDRFIQVMLNLLSNALNAIEPGSGRVEVSVGIASGEVRVDVTDNGPGIASADHEIIFAKFRQAAAGGADRSHGTGLGLHISRRIVERFGGRMWVESNPGSGARFSYTLPLAG